MIRIAVDGPGGAGKSSLAKAVAKRLGIIYVDTGALYRTIGLFMLNNGIDPHDTDVVISHLGDFTLDLTFVDGEQKILLNGKDVGDSIRTQEISLAASAVSAIPEVRDFLLNTQRSIAAKHSVIMDGRDIGTVILPDAEVKIFLTASAEARAKRRYDELIARGQNVTYERVYDEMVQRDTNDSTRAVAPCVPAKDAILLDNSKLNAEQTVFAVIKIVKQFERKRTGKGYMFLRAIASPFIKFFCRLKIHGKENLPSDGGYMICSNHIAIRDVFLIGVGCNKPVKFIAKKELFSVPILRSVIKSLGAIPIDRGGSDVGAIKSAITSVKHGNAVAIFPQGHRNPGVPLDETEVRSGAGMIAYRSGCDVVPVCISVRDNRYRLFRRVDIIFGKPIANTELGFINGGSDEYKTATERIFAEIIALGRNTDRNGKGAKLKN